jgi:SAM-dependent methyltransferase
VTSAPDHRAQVRDYYERNTRRFLAASDPRSAVRAIHRAVWLPGVENAHQALDAVNALIAHEVERHAATRGLAKVHLLDLGCGVGGSLFYLIDHLPLAVEATGVTISPAQVALARQGASARGLSDGVHFFEADFHALPSLPPADAAFAVEAFAHADHPAQFFASAAVALAPGGILILCDDFLTPVGRAAEPESDDGRRIAEFRSGWGVPALTTARCAEALAAEAGFSLAASRDLTPSLHLNRPRDHLIAAVALGRPFVPLRWPYWRSLVGGDALRACLRRGLVAYRFLVFEKRAASITTSPSAHRPA